MLCMLMFIAGIMVQEISDMNVYGRCLTIIILGNKCEHNINLCNERGNETLMACRDEICKSYVSCHAFTVEISDMKEQLSIAEV